jgi:hypothetical protein
MVRYDGATASAMAHAVNRRCGSAPVSSSFRRAGASSTPAPDDRASRKAGTSSTPAPDDRVLSISEWDSASQDAAYDVALQFQLRGR